MDWDRIKSQLEQVLQSPVELLRWPNKEWSRLSEEQAPPDKACKSAVFEHKVLFYLETLGSETSLFAVEDTFLTQSERRLVEMVIDSMRSQERGRAGTPAAEEERKARLLKEWFYRQLEEGRTNAEIPDTLAAQLSLHAVKIPILLFGDYSDARNVHYHDLKKLLESFFETDVVLIPLMEKEWLILGPESIVAASGGEDKDGPGESALEEALESILFGLHEMLSNEWVGECHVAIHYPIKPAKGLLAAILQLRETIALGKTFDVGRNIHLPWKLHLEKLLAGVPDADKLAFVSHVLKRIDHMLDAETQSTLEQFFALDCNVSETAKKLYIHRNTLLYRLDRFKQETGLDVRTFSDAVLVKVALLLYKVTKRK